ncbi:MAG: ThuA domain-containing protein [Lewinellaceae bacterium]|nr:ThuA domain-containing protein [Lewinellaceae bacterium]
MKKIFYALLLVAGTATGFLAIQSCSSNGKGPKVLVLAKSEFYFHESTAAALEALTRLGDENGWSVVETDDAGDYINEKELPKYAAVVFLNTAGDVLNPTQEALFEQYIQAGGGFVGIHTAIDTEHSWDWYGQLVGARYDGNMEVQNATLLVQDRKNPATKHLDSTWQRTDEWFNMIDLSPDINVLLTLDESTCKGGKMGNYHPVSWYHEFDGGRAFITAMGHTPESYSDPAFLQHLNGGLKYAVGNNKGPLRFKRRRAKTQETVMTGFVRTQLVCNLYEPMELDMLPDGRILFIERRGAVKLYDPAKDTTSIVGQFDVFLENEEGLLGLAIDPHWEENHWIYLYYSPAGKATAIKLSRFVFPGDMIQRETEQVILEVKTDRSVHNYHAAGCIEFDAKGFLYLSCGDNTDHYPDGYNSIDERPGNSQFDAQKSAANTMDLRGKILRFKVLPDGSYLCPADNLFTTEVVRMKNGKPVATPDLLLNGIQPFMPAWAAERKAEELLAPVKVEKPWHGLPEIYVMGVRNPFRFAIDDRRGILFWGEPGPDAGDTSAIRGPMGYDEFNFTRTAGNFGWPYLQGNNKPYRDYNFETEKSGDYFDPNHLINDSPNNTGDKLLPPAHPAIIWYPFRSSEEFPILVNGTRCAMGGPVYWCDQYPAETRFPARYDGQVIIYEWMRHWILSYGLDSLDRLTKIQPLASNIRFARPMDMLIDKNGSLWVLEYGTEWYAQNPDACLSRIDYIRGANGEEPLVQEGVNNPPMVRWNLRGQNQSFYKPGEQVRYSVAVSDPEDGSLDDHRITPDMVNVSIEYLKSVKKAGLLAAVYRPNSDTPEARGKALIDDSDCKSCHALDRKINGPAYKDIAEKYAKDPEGAKGLPQKIIKGGAGVWGEDLFMAAHPDISPKQAADIVSWILSINDPKNYPLPTVGLYTLNLPDPEDKDGAFVFHARYKDLGGVELESHTGSQNLVLRSPFQQAANADSLSADVRVEKTGACLLRKGSILVYKNIDLKGVLSIDIGFGKSADVAASPSSRIEVHIGSPDGRLAGTVSLPAAPAEKATLEIDRSTWPTNGALYDLYFVVLDDSDNAKPLAAVDWLQFNL